MRPDLGQFSLPDLLQLILEAGVLRSYDCEGRRVRLELDGYTTTMRPKRARRWAEQIVCTPLPLSVR